MGPRGPPGPQGRRGPPVSFTQCTCGPQLPARFNLPKFRIDCYSVRDRLYSLSYTLSLYRVHLDKMVLLEYQETEELL